MVRAIPMTPEQIERIVALASADPVIMEAFRLSALELDRHWRENPNGNPPDYMEHPPPDEAIAALIERELGPGPWIDGVTGKMIRKGRLAAGLENKF